MSKKFSRINFILVSLLVAVGLFLSFFTFKIPFYVNNYAGFANAITLSYDLGNAQTAVYQVQPISEEVTTVSDKQLEDTLSLIRKVLNAYGATNNQVGFQNNDEIRAMIPANETSEGLLGALASRVAVTVRGESSEEKTKYDIAPERIVSARASYQSTSSTSSSYSFGVILEFDSLGAKQYKELTKQVADNGNTLYFYDADGNQLGSLGEITREQFSSEVFMPISSLTSENAAKLYSANVMMGTINTQLKLKENSVETSYLGKNFALIASISLGIAFVLVTIAMILRYRDLGLIFMLTSLINLVLYLFLLQALPIVTLSILGLAGCVFGYGLTVLCHVIIFQKIRKEYALGRKIPLAFKLGFKNSLFNVIDICAVALISALAMYFAGFEVVKSFAISLAIGSLLSVLSSLVFTKIFTKWYLPLNSTKASHLALKKETADEE